MWPAIASNIVSLRAEYGRDTSAPPDAIVDLYDQTQPGTACGWAAVYALRIALVARSAQFDKAVLTSTAPTWMGSANTPVVLTADDNWQHYRYKVFQTVVPIRNVAWLGVQSGC